MVNFSLEGKVALVTGASYGIGFALATAYAQAGAKIVFNDIKQELVDKGLAAYKAEGIDAKGYVCDVTNEEQVNAMVAQIEKEVGVIDILVNNAGIIKRIPMHEMSAAEFRQVIDVDLNAPFIVSKAVIPSMIKKGHGKIINICSMMSELGRETVSAYAAAKGGLKMLTRNIASEYGEYNIQCNGIGPGYIATPQTAPLREPQADGSRHPFDAFIVAKTPAARWGTPEDLMGPAVFLASDASDFVNGHVLYVDGGILACLTFCYCDLDHLKYINDQYGHTEGDWYITFFVETIQKHIRKEDVFARIGGDEFCVILYNCPYEMAERKIRKIQKEFSSGQTKEYPKSFSCGIVEVEGGNEELQVRDIIKQADHEMYLQKKEHKKKYRKELSVISISED